MSVSNVSAMIWNINVSLVKVSDHCFRLESAMEFDGMNSNPWEKRGSGNCFKDESDILRRIEGMSCMAAKVAMIFVTPLVEVLHRGLQFASSALRHGWLDEVKVILFGVSEKVILDDERLRGLLLELSKQTDVVACKAVADRENLTPIFQEHGVPVEFVGPLIGDYVRIGYTPMVW